MHHHRPVPSTPVDSNATATTTTPPLDSNPINPSYQNLPTDDRRRWGWRTCRERKMEERRLREEALRSQAQAQPDSSNSVSQDAAHVEQKETEFQSIREAVEKLWSEKRAEANEAQKRANDKVSSSWFYINQRQAVADSYLQAKEYATERLEKLTAALERLRVVSPPLLF